MSSRSERRRSGVWQPEASNVVEKEKKHRWPGHDKQRKEPSLYDEYLTQEKKQKGTQQPPTTSEGAPRSRAIDRPSMPLRQGSTTASGTTIRPVTPEERQHHAGLGIEHSSVSVPDSASIPYDRVFIPHTTTTIVGGPAARVQNSPSGSSRSKKFSRGHDKEEREARTGRASQARSSPSSRNGSVIVSTSSFLRRSSSRDNVRRAHGIADGDAIQRPRTRTMDDRSRREQSPTALLAKNRNRSGSVHAPSSPIVYQQDGAEYLASVPGSAETPLPPSISAVGSSPMHSPAEGLTYRPISPASTTTVDSITSALPAANARRILHLMKTLQGRMSGNVTFRRGFGNPWLLSYCYIHEDTGSLMYESRGSEGAHKILISSLQGTKVRSSLEGDIPFLEVTLPHTADEVHIKLQTQSDFDAWFAALLHWTPRDSHSISSNDQRPDSEMSSKPSALADQSKRRASVHNPLNRNGRERAASDRSHRSDRRRSVIATMPKENPVIKIGKMIYWDTNVGYSNGGPGAFGQPSSRPSAYRMQSVGARRWRRISGQLRENGELKLHSDSDNSLISVVQLSQLSRCAIQRLDRSVLDNDFCIAIYPQYTSSYTNNQPGFIRPIFLSLESRVLYEVWYVLLRAFTMPSIYGPRMDIEGLDYSEMNLPRDLESMIATSTTYTFRMERSLSVRVVEAKMQAQNVSSNDIGFTSGHSKHPANLAPEMQGYYAEVLLDNETRGKTAVKFDGLSPLWGETFEFQDLPPVLSNASVMVKRRPPEQASLQHDSHVDRDANAQQQQGGFIPLAVDVPIGKVEIQMEELEPEKEVEKWWPVINMHGHRVGEIMVKVRADEGIVLMARDYQPLSQLLHRFSNGLTLQIAQMIPSELKRLSDSLLNIFQVSGKAGEWLMALVEEEIDGANKETPITRLRYSRRVGSNDNQDPMGTGSPSTDREILVRDMNKNATLEANLLFRGNTLLTKSLDTHMRRVGKEYLEESLAAKIQEINDKDLDYEVDPNKVDGKDHLHRNWSRLLTITQEVWKAIVAKKDRCPIELKIVFRHIRACAEDRYGDFLRSVSYSSVSGFLFLRFFCPAVLNPKLFGLLKDDIKPRARRTFTLIAKSLQTMANMASFGTKEPWMEPMNVFLIQNRDGFKTFIDDICYVPAPLTSATFGPNQPSSPTYPPGVVSAEQHLSYTTPMTIMQRLPPSSREGFPSLPYLIDQARAFAELIHLWLESLNALSNSGGSAALPGKTHSDVLHAIEASNGDLKDFHHVCEDLFSRTQECLARAERAERPDSPHEFQWEDVINQLQKTHVRGLPGAISREAFELVADKIASDPSVIHESKNPTIEATMARLRGEALDEADEPPSHSAPPIYSRTPPQAESAVNWEIPRPGSTRGDWARPGSASLGSSFNGNRGHLPGSPGASASVSTTNASSNVSSDAEHSNTPTALPNYDREVRHRERREAARIQIQQQYEAARAKEKEKERDRRKMNKLVPALRKKNRQHVEEEGRGNLI